MGAVNEYAAALASMNGKGPATVRADAAVLARCDPSDLDFVWAALREAGHGDQEITDLRQYVAHAAKPWWADFEPDEAGQADAFLHLHGENWAFVTGLERWHCWKGAHWQVDDTRAFRRELGAMLDMVHGEAINAARQMLRQAETMKDPNQGANDPARAAMQEAKAAMARAMAWRRADRRLNAIDSLCRDERAIHHDRLDAGNLLNLANGTLDLDTYTLSDHTRADMLTHCLGYAYDPAATCPRWLQFLSEVLVAEDGQTPDPELAELFQEAIGYALTVETRYEAMFWLSGGGANGKSTALGVVQALLGDGLAASLDLGALGRPDASYYLAGLSGARVVFSTEAGKGQAVADDILKRLASGEPIPARPIRGEPITIKPVCKLFWALNDTPTVKDTSDGFWRRLRLIPFNRQFAEDERDTQLAVKLREELPGILNWALVGLRRLRANGRFTDAAAVREAVTEYRTTQNAVALWLNERTTHARPEGYRPPDATTRAREAFQDYLQWCAETNRHTKTETAFGADLGKLVRKSRSNGGMVYHFGLLLLDNGPMHYTDREGPDIGRLQWRRRNVKGCPCIVSVGCVGLCRVFYKSLYGRFKAFFYVQPFMENPAQPYTPCTTIHTIHAC